MAETPGVEAQPRNDPPKTGEVGEHSNAIKFLNQDYESLKQQCLKGGTLFEDPHFPTAASSLGFKELGPRSPLVKGVQWKRPSEITSKPQFIVGGAQRTDICQGKLGDCWLLSAIGSLTLNDKLLHRVVPPGQGFQDDYAGIFHFQIWHFGVWVEVVIDDRLPVKDDKLLFVHSAEHTEFWSALLEKAYAKLNGSYEALSGGMTSEGFEDFTGGVAEMYKLKKAPKDLYRIMRKAIARGSLLGCFINITSTLNREAITSKKLVKGHAYSISGLKEVKYKGQLEPLVRIRNPWGDVEWTGAWSDKSPEWNEVDPAEKELCVKKNDGEFWMSFKDFLLNFSNIEICNLTPDALEEDDMNKWHTTIIEGSWRRGSSDGGGLKFPDTFWINPQYKVTLLEEDEDSEDNEAACSLLVALMQKNRRQLLKLREYNLDIGFAIYELKGGQSVHFTKDFFLNHEPCAQAENIGHFREVSTHIRLPPGEYIVVPYTKQPHKEADFVLRVFTEKLSNTEELDEEVTVNLSNEDDISKDDVDYFFQKMFEQMAEPEMEISVSKLQTILNDAVKNNKDLKTDGFSMESCRQIVNLLDKDGNAKLGLVEFHTLWKKLQQWMAIFQQYDLDRSGTMSSYELRMALKEAGFKLNNKIIQVLVARYSDTELGVDFDNFFCVLVKLEAAFRLFSSKAKDDSETIAMGLAKWLILQLSG
ncbi:calpain-1 catalytic subunit-like [Lissotriton helveticus]